MLCINPHSVSSQMAPSSRACLRHHAVLSGMFAGTIVPYHLEKESAGSAAALPNFLRPACAKNNAFLIARSNWKKHHMSERRNHFWIDRARERTSFWWQPEPNQEKQYLISRKHTHTYILATTLKQPIFLKFDTPAKRFWVAKLGMQRARPVWVRADEQLRIIVRIACLHFKLLQLLRASAEMQTPM